MGTLSLKRDRSQVDVPIKGDDVMPELAPQWDAAKPYLGMGGMVGVAFMQGDNYFNCRKEFVKEVPVADRREMPKPKKQSEVFHRGPRGFGSAPVVPQTVLDAQKENARVLAAESQAG